MKKNNKKKLLSRSRKLCSRFSQFATTLLSDSDLQRHILPTPKHFDTVPEKPSRKGSDKVNGSFHKNRVTLEVILKHTLFISD